MTNTGNKFDAFLAEAHKEDKRTEEARRKFEAAKAFAGNNGVTAVENQIAEAKAAEARLASSNVNTKTEVADTKRSSKKLVKDSERITVYIDENVKARLKVISAVYRDKIDGKSISELAASLLFDKVKEIEAEVNGGRPLV